MLHVQLLYIHTAVDFQMLAVYNVIRMGRKNKLTNLDKVKCLGLLSK